MAQPAADLLEEQIQAYLRRPVVIKEISENFKNLPETTINMKPVKYDFPDDSLLGENGISLKRLDPEHVAELGRAVIPMVANGFSRSGAAALFVLAYNTFSLERGRICYVFQGEEEIAQIGDKEYSDFSDRKMPRNKDNVEVIVPHVDRVHEAAVCSFVAASMMRLFTKSATNYVRAWNHIKNGFSKFYGKEMNVELPAPTETAINGLRDWMSIVPRAKIALYRLLYLGNSNDNQQGLKRFLYEIHLANTGMHLAGMFVHLCKILNCRSDLLLQLINVKEYERQVECLIRLIDLMKSTDANHMRGMWKYGRIFDDSFMADIQTKSCPKLVYIFAEALKSVAQSSYQDVLQIAQLADVSDANKKKCKDFARKMVETVRAYNNKDNQGGGGSFAGTM